MRFLFHYPETGELFDGAALGEVAAAVERAGFDGLSLSEHPVPGARWLASGGHQTLDPFVALGYAAAVTRRLRLLTYLAVAPYRNPFLLAKAAATLDRVSGGRVILGVGVGYQKSEFHALGVDFDERNTLLDEALDVLPLHWRGEPFSYQGRHFDARNVVALPRPVQDPIPIWIGGNSALSRRRVAARAQGWMPMSAGAQLAATARTPVIGSVPELAARIAELRDAAGREVDVLHSYDAAGSGAADADRHREAFAELEKAGVTWVVVASRTDALSATLDFVEGFGAAHLGEGRA